METEELTPENDASAAVADASNEDGHAETRQITEMSVDEDNNSPDFSYLPETAWVRILQFLPLKDRCHVSVTCSRLCHLLNHPALWKSAYLSLVGGETNFLLTRTFMPQQFKRIVERFGHLFQRLTIMIHGHLIRFEDDTRDILSKMTKVCRLEHLVLQVGLVTSEYHRHGYKPRYQDLFEITRLVSSAFRLKDVEILSWPMFPEIFLDETLNVFDVMKKNPKLENLETLKLFWLKDRQWSELAPLLPSAEYTLTLVSHFRFLRHLALRSPMVSSELLLELASITREKLLSLQILVLYNAHNVEFHIPSISSSVWTALRAASPELAVECAIMSRVPDIELAVLLVPEMPLVAIKFLKYSRCSPQMLFSLKNKYSESLQSVTCYSDPTDCQSELVELVRVCKKVNSLIFHGQIHCQRVTELAGLRDRWNEFEFVEKQITTEREQEDFDEDIVIGQDARGDLVQVGLVRFLGYESEEDRDRALDGMCQEVSKHVGYSWMPVK